MATYNDLAKKIKDAQCILLTTHRSCDADGFGSELALYHTIRKLNKEVHIIHYEPVHPRYDFLNKKNIVKVFDESTPKLNPDLIIVLDTNDQRLIEPLFQSFNGHCPIIYVDHHQVMESAPQPTNDSIIDASSASTGQMAYDLIKTLNISLDEDIAFALYTSIAFDTNVFKYIRSSGKSYQIAAELLNFNIDSTYIHRMLFANSSVDKLKFLSHILNQIEFHDHNQLAYCFVSQKDMQIFNAGIEETHDILDHVMSVGDCKLAILVREQSPDTYRISFRSKDNITVTSIAEAFKGGGHSRAAGATVRQDYKKLKLALLELAHNKLA